MKSIIFAKDRERVYIVPTRYGHLAFAGIFFLFGLGAYYKSPLSYFFAILAATVVSLAMLQSNNNLKNLIISNFQALPGPEGSTFNVQCEIKNLSREPKYGLCLDYAQSLTELEELPALSAKNTGLKVHYPKRGLYQSPSIRISAIFPLGLFFAWQWQRPRGSTLVYPEPLSLLPLPLPQFNGQNASNRSEKALFKGHRLYRSGDSLSDIDWKQRARGGPLLIKEYEDPERPPLVLAFDELEQIFSEKLLVPADQNKIQSQTLGQLTAWILSIDEDQTFSLRLPGTLIDPSMGPAHKLLCLSKLATYS